MNPRFYLPMGLGVAILVSSVLADWRETGIVDIQVAPQTLQLSKIQSGSVTVHTNIPAREVITSTVQLSGLDATGCGVDSQGNLVANFSEQQVKAMVSPPSATLTLTGLTQDEQEFAGSDTVQVRR